MTKNIWQLTVTGYALNPEQVLPQLAHPSTVSTKPSRELVHFFTFFLHFLCFRSVFHLLVSGAFLSSVPQHSPSHRRLSPPSPPQCSSPPSPPLGLSSHGCLSPHSFFAGFSSRRCLSPRSPPLKLSWFCVSLVSFTSFNSLSIKTRKSSPGLDRSKLSKAFNTLWQLSACDSGWHLATGRAGGAATLVFWLCLRLILLAFANSMTMKVPSPIKNSTTSRFRLLLWIGGMSWTISPTMLVGHRKQDFGHKSPSELLDFGPRGIFKSMFNMWCPGQAAQSLAKFRLVFTETMILVLRHKHFAIAQAQKVQQNFELSDAPFQDLANSKPPHL